MKWHLGLHLTTLKETAAHWELEELLQYMRTIKANPKGKWLIVLVYRKGTHRSVAISELLELLFEKYIYNNTTAVENRVQKESQPRRRHPVGPRIQASLM